MKNSLIKLALSLSLATAAFAGGGGDIFRASFTADNLEYQFNDDKTLYWDTYGYAGYDLNKVYIYSEGEKADGASAESENQLL